MNSRYAFILVLTLCVFLILPLASAGNINITITNPVEGRNYNSTHNLETLQYNYIFNDPSLHIDECWWGNETFNRTIGWYTTQFCSKSSPVSILIRLDSIYDWNPMSSELGDSSGNHTWYLFMKDSNNNVTSAKVSFMVGSLKPITPCLSNTTTGWINFSCVTGVGMNQTRTFVNYSYSGTTCISQTYYEYRINGSCNNASLCINTLTNISTGWTNIACTVNNTMNQTRNTTRYDSALCGNVTNMTFIDYRATESCTYNTSCYTNWTCSYWDPCEPTNTQSRLCVKENASCDLPFISLVQNCTYVEENLTVATLFVEEPIVNNTVVVEDPKTPWGWKIWMYIILAIILIALLLWFLWYKFIRDDTEDSDNFNRSHGKLVDVGLTPEQKAWQKEQKKKALEEEKLAKERANEIKKMHKAKLEEETLKKEISSDDIREYLKDKNKKL